MINITEDEIISIDIDNLDSDSNKKLIQYDFNNENCEYIYIKGKNAGNRCSKKLSEKTQKYCNMHKKNI